MAELLVPAWKSSGSITGRFLHLKRAIIAAEDANLSIMKASTGVDPESSGNNSAQGAHRRRRLTIPSNWQKTFS